MTARPIEPNRLPEGIRKAYGTLEAACAIMDGHRLVQIEVQIYPGDCDRIDIWVRDNGEWCLIRDPHYQPALIGE